MIRMTIADAYAEFMHDRKTFAALATIKKYENDLGLFFRYLTDQTGKEMAALSFPRENIFKEYIIHLRSKGLRSVTIRSYCRSIKVFLRFCYEADYCPDYLKNVKLPRDDAVPKIPLYSDEVQRIDATFNRSTILGIRNYCIVHLMLDCGLRRQEVIKLKTDDLIRDRNVIRILDSKGAKSRMTLIPDFLIAAIDDYMARSAHTSGVIFRSVRGTGSLTDNSVKMLFQDLKAASGIDRLHAHLLRHTFATSYLLGGGNLEFLRVFMGHSDYTVTKTYSQLAAQMQMLGADIYHLDPIFFTRGY